MSCLDKAVILPIDTGEVALYWPFVQEYIQDAVERSEGEVSADSIFTDIVNHLRQLWVIKYEGQYIAAVVTRIYQTDTGIKIGEITMAGGSNHKVWDHFADVMAAWFSSQGCKYQDIIGRQGWFKLYEKRGFRIAYQQIRRNLDDGGTPRCQAVKAEVKAAQQP
jgi:hypothetical protein